MAEAQFIGCPEAEKTRAIFAAATCPDCRRKGKVAVTTAGIVHKTMLCVDCSEKRLDASADKIHATTKGNLINQIACAIVDAQVLRIPNRRRAILCGSEMANQTIVQRISDHLSISGVCD